MDHLAHAFIHIVVISFSLARGAFIFVGQKRSKKPFGKIESPRLSRWPNTRAQRLQQHGLHRAIRPIFRPPRTHQLTLSGFQPKTVNSELLPALRPPLKQAYRHTLSLKHSGSSPQG